MNLSSISPKFSISTSPIMIFANDKVLLVPTMVLSTIALLAVVTFIPWAVPMFSFSAK